jgi:hypothetical protein
VNYPAAELLGISRLFYNIEVRPQITVHVSPVCPRTGMKEAGVADKMDRRGDIVESYNSFSR